MMEFVFEFSLSVIDYTYLLCFYNVLIGRKWKWKRAIVWILSIVCIQYIKDMNIDFGGFSSFLDDVFVITFLFLFSKNYTFKNLLYACMMNVIFTFAITFLVSLAIECNIDISNTLLFGMPRVLFSVFLKSCTILLFITLLKPMKKMQLILHDKAEYLMVFIMCSIANTFSFIYGDSQGNRSVFLYCLLLSIILIAVLYLFYNYCMNIKQQADTKLIQYSIETTMEYVGKLEKEHAEVRKIRHDMQNQLNIIYMLLKDKKYEEVNILSKQLANTVDDSKVSISENIYIDAILRQKMAQFSSINFSLDIQISKDFKMDGKDIISLLSNIIDNACEELIRNGDDSFSLKLIGNDTQFIIDEQNPCHENRTLQSSKDKKEHGFGLKIIKEIVEKQEGYMEIYNEDGMFKIHILLVF